MPLPSLERVVRPLVPPDLRPPVARPALSEEDDRGVARISGASGSLITLNHTFSENISRSRQTESGAEEPRPENSSEIGRWYDVMRVFNPENEEQFVDVEAVTKLFMNDSRGIEHRYIFNKPKAVDTETSHIEIIAEDKKR